MTENTAHEIHSEEQNLADSMRQASANGLSYNKRNYRAGIQSLKREWSWCEASRILEETCSLENALASRNLSLEETMRFAGMARELLEFGSTTGNPCYALLGGRVYQQLGKGNRSFVLKALERSLQNMLVSRETKMNWLDVLGSGFTTTITYSDTVANGYRVREEDVTRARKYLEERK